MLVNSQVHRFLLDLFTESTGVAVSEIDADILELGPQGVMPGKFARARHHNGIEGCRHMALTLTPLREIPGRR